MTSVSWSLAGTNGMAGTTTQATCLSLEKFTIFLPGE